MSRQEIVDSLAEYMMINRCGFSPDSKETFPLEWDRTYEDSQIALMIDDIDMILDFLEETYGYDFSVKPLNDK